MQSETIQNEWTAFFHTRTSPSESGCILWNLCKDNLGYGRCTERHGEVKAHRVSWVLAFGEIPSNLCVLHTCDVRHCVNPEHLWLGTQTDNIQDMIKKRRNKGRPQIGSANPMSRLNEDTVWAIRCMIKHNMFSQREIAIDYDVSPMTISRIANNKSWIHVTENWPWG